jgi:hypothetical protein
MCTHYNLDRSGNYQSNSKEITEMIAQNSSEVYGRRYVHGRMQYVPLEEIAALATTENPYKTKKAREQFINSVNKEVQAVTERRAQYSEYKAQKGSKDGR